MTRPTPLAPATPAASPGPLAPTPIAESPATKQAFALAERAAASSITVLVAGETGSGKEWIARTLHRAGPRCTQPFVCLNCAAVPETLLDSELFGHVRGAFTGADRDRTGVFEEARDGTLFLDEVTEAPPSIQAKLLRVLQEREIRPVGSSRPRPIRCRVVASSNRDLRAEVREGRFREDLFYRLSTLTIHVPPLRRRPEDILPLAEHFLALHAARDGKPGLSLTASGARSLLSRDWPGNVRELENTIAGAVALAEPGARLDADTLRPPRVSLAQRAEEPTDAVHDASPTPATLSERVEAFERIEIRASLTRNGHHRTRTARELGLTREGLYKKMKRLGVE